jgi:hypothetical protein
MGAPVSKTGVPYGFHAHAPADIRLVLANGKAMNPSSGGLAKRLRNKISASNKAEEKLKAAICKGASRDEPRFKTTAITPSTWFDNASGCLKTFFFPAEPTSRPQAGTANEAGLPAQPVTDCNSHPLRHAPCPLPRP